MGRRRDLAQILPFDEPLSNPMAARVGLRELIERVERQGRDLGWKHHEGADSAYLYVDAEEVLGRLRLVLLGYEHSLELVGAPEVIAQADLDQMYASVAELHTPERDPPRTEEQLTALNEMSARWAAALTDGIKLHPDDEAVAFLCDVIDDLADVQTEARRWAERYRTSARNAAGPIAVSAESIEVSFAHLVEHVGALIAERDELERQLTVALDDKEAARATVDILVAENARLRHASTVTSPKHRRRLIGIVASGAVPVLAFLGGHTSAVVQGEYGIHVADIGAESQEAIADADRHTAIRVARIAANAQIEAAEIAAECGGP